MQLSGGETDSRREGLLILANTERKDLRVSRIALVSGNFADRSIRSLTAEAHRRLDQTLGSLNLSDARDYGDLLSVMARGFAAAEVWLADHWGLAPEDSFFIRRSDLARQDLLALGGDASAAVSWQAEAQLAVSATPGTAEVLGVIYTLEGSRMGAQFLRRQLPTDGPRSFLDDPRHMIEFPRLRRVLQGLGDHDTAKAAGSALAVFALFQHFADALPARGGNIG